MDIKRPLAVLTAFIMVLSAGSCDGGGHTSPVDATTTAATSDPNKIEVPDFSGLTRVQVEMKYPKLNIKFEEKYDDSFPEDEVISQSPAAGTTVNRADEITVSVSIGAKQVEIDDYTGKNIEDVRILLDKQGLICETQMTDDESMPRNCVLRTTPAARTRVDKGSTVICYVSLGPVEADEVRVPDFVNMSVEDAARLATDKEITLAITYDNTSALEAGTVISQGVPPDEIVSPGDRIEVVIAGENAAAIKRHNIVITMNYTVEGEFEFKYYIDGTLQRDMTEIKEISLTRKIDWAVSGTGKHSYSIMVTSLRTGKTGKFLEVDVDFTTSPPTQSTTGTFDPNIIYELMEQ